MDHRKDYIGKKIVDIVMVESDDFPQNDEVDRIYFVFEGGSVLALMTTVGERWKFGLDVLTLSRHGEDYIKREKRFAADERVLTPFIGTTLMETWDIFTENNGFCMYAMAFDKGLPGLVVSPKWGHIVLYAARPLADLPAARYGVTSLVNPMKKSTSAPFVTPLAELLFKALSISGVYRLPVNAEDKGGRDGAQAIAFCFKKMNKVLLLSPMAATNEIDITIQSTQTLDLTWMSLHEGFSTFVGSPIFSIYPGMSNINATRTFCLLEEMADAPSLMVSSKGGLLHLAVLEGPLDLTTPYPTEKKKEK